MFLAASCAVTQYCTSPPRNDVAENTLAGPVTGDTTDSELWPGVNAAPSAALITACTTAGQPTATMTSGSVTNQPISGAGARDDLAIAATIDCRDARMACQDEAVAMKRQAEFPWKVRKLIAERAGYRCSKPDCRRPTLGPGARPDEVACTGVACHIYSASPGGPRGTGGLSIEQLQSAVNGIWLCAEHARLADANQGLGYPPQLLYSWRQLHEAYLVQEMRGLVAPRGLITGITVYGGPGALAARPVALSVLNLIIGPNCTGKSLLLDLLAGAAGNGSLGARPWTGDLAADIQWFDPQPHTLGLQASGSRLSFHLDHKPVPCVTAPYYPVVVRTLRRHLTGPGDCAELFGLDINAFINLLLEVPSRVWGEVSRVDLIDGAPLIHLRFWPEPVRLEGHPGNAATWTVLFETAIALAQLRSQAGPTLLLVDDFGDFFPPALVDKLFRKLTEATAGFQTIVVTHHLLAAEALQHWSITELSPDRDAIIVGT